MLLIPRRKRIYVPRPTWTPRPRIRWCPVHRRIVNMAAGDRLLTEDGDRILDDDGDVMLSDGAGDDCCCGCEESTCLCDDGGAICNTATVTFASVSLCTCSDTFYKPSGNANGTFTLTWTSGCTWIYEDLVAPFPVTVAAHSGVNCTGGTTASTVTFSIDLFYEAVSNTWVLSMYAVFASFSVRTIFSGQLVVATNCNDGFVINNGIGDSSECTVFGGYTGYGGTGTVSFP